MRHRLLLPIVSLAFAGLTIFLGYFVQRIDFQTFIAAYSAFFGLFIWVVFYRQEQWSATKLRYLIWLGIGLRVLLLFSIPNLSDDYARFLWDGHLTVAGIHPFTHPPDYFIEHQILPPGITPELFHKLNSPHYFTVYPPVCQAIFALAAWIFPTNEWGGVVVMKLFLLACEVGTIMLLGRIKGRETDLNPTEINHAPLIYALNPLAILEITGNCHFEGAMIFFLLAGLYALQKQAIKWSAIYWALATACKMLPLMFLPVLWRWLGWQKGTVFNVVFGLASLLLFAPLLAVLPNILESLDLYFRQFQFNASIYYLVRQLGFWIKGWDIGESSGPVLAALTILGVFFIAWKTKPGAAGPFSAPAPQSNTRFSDLNTPLLFALCLYHILSATVQPWYLTVPLALSLHTRWRFMVVWSGLGMLSYSHYHHGKFLENYPLIWLEYSLLFGFFIWEFRHIFVKKPVQISS